MRPNALINNFDLKYPKVNFLSFSWEGVSYAVCVAVLQEPLDTLLEKLDLLHVEERRQFHSFKYDLRRTSYLLGRFAAKKALVNLTKASAENAIWIDYGILRFPIVRCPAIQNTSISISHCDDFGVSIAFPEICPIGIDLERINPDKLKPILSQVGESEKIQLEKEDLNNLTGYTILWTMKEALSKVLKTGISIDFKLLNIVNIINHDGVFESDFSIFRQYKAYAFVKNGYAMAIVLPSKINLDPTQIQNLI